MPVSLRDRLHDAMIAATRSGDVVRRDALRMTWSALYVVEKRDGTTLTDQQTIAVLARELKTRRESVEAFRAGGREDLAAPEEAAIAILAEFMPQPLDDDALDALVAEAIAATGATSSRDLGKVMGWLAPRTRGRADGKVVSGRVAAALASLEAGGGGRG